MSADFSYQAADRWPAREAGSLSQRPGAGHGPGAVTVKEIGSTRKRDSLYRRQVTDFKIGEQPHVYWN